MPNVLDRPAVAPRKTVRQLTWQATVLVIGVLGFMSFVLWLTASHFDASEFKALAGVALGSIGREFFPVIKQILRSGLDAHGDAGQLE